MSEVDHELLDYDEEENDAAEELESAATGNNKEVKGSYVSIHSSGFRDFLLKPELLRAIVDCGFEHPSAGMCALFLYSIFYRRNYGLCGVDVYIIRVLAV